MFGKGHRERVGIMSDSRRASGEDSRISIAGRFQLVTEHILVSGYHKYCPGESWTPALNLYEDDRNYYVVANLAGAGTQAIDLECKEGRLVLSGHRSTPPPPEVHGELVLHHMEIDHGRFRRILELPADVNTDGIEAVYRTGQLLITLPKKT